VRAEFGSDALILDTRRVKRRGLLGWVGQRQIEVTAASEPSPGPAVVNKFVDEVRRVFPEAARENEPVGVPESMEIQRGTEPAVLASRARLHQVLTSNGIAGVLARQLVNEAARACRAAENGEVPAETSLRRELLRRLRRVLGFPEPLPHDPGRQIVALFVGPTGVGKTTTVAKLAARHALDHGWNVEVITTDTYRVAAVEQLAQYAELIGVPFNTAQSPEEAERYVRQSRADLVLVDSAGRSHLDEERMGELETLARVIEPTHAFLCLALTSRDRDAAEAVDRYDRVGFNRLLFTKLDETRQPGLCVNIAHRVKVPLSYLTTGQRVPEDLVVARAGDLAERLLEVRR